MKTLWTGIFALLVGVWAFALPTKTPAIAQTTQGLEYVSPLPGAQLVSAETTIAVRPGQSLVPGTVNAALFSVVGAKSGEHRGSAVLADDSKTVIFKPEQPFLAGEEVTVALHQGLKTTSGQSVAPASFHFTISPHPAAPVSTLLPDEENLAPWAPAKPSLSTAPRFVTVPPDFPTYTVTTAANGTANGYVFIAPFPWGAGGAPYLLILDNSGQPVYYQRANGQLTDFKVQPNGLLTYFQGGQFYAMDSTYNVIDTYAAGNGYVTDEHELQLLPNGHALLLGKDYETMDLTQVVPGGQPNATVIGLVIQELDTAKNVVFQWRSWDHFLITDTQVSQTDPRVDYVHGNAIAVDWDGNLLLSSRHLSEVTKICWQAGNNCRPGDIIWRLGGKNNQFNFTNDAQFHFQHDIRRLPNMDITLFDDRTDLSPLYSRAVEYQLDETAKTATLVWEYRDTPDVYAAAMGNVQRLSNGNTPGDSNSFIGWGTGATVTEVKPDGSKAFELTLGTSQMTYRAFRFPWLGHPATPPTLVLQKTSSAITLTYSWNGATDIASYRVYGGSQLSPTTLLATQAKTGFETQTVVPNNSNQCLFFRVMPIDNQGNTTQYSNQVSTCYLSYFPLVTK
ncbi:MAG: aryl-sulfate sulfotransferase [Chloroflexi bacterium]|nr:aryl-sulfate sulfotransferase [Chloroflexota bacterium]